MREISYADAINESLRQSMQLSRDVVLLGQLVDYQPAVFGTVKGLVEQFGKERVRDFPNAESVMTAAALGGALTGLRPILLHPRFDFMLYSLDAIVNWMSLWRFKTNRASNLPVTIKVIVGKGWGQGPQHSKSLHAWFAHLPGLRVAMPATAYDLKGLMLESVFGETPSMIVEHRALFSMMSEVPEEPYRVRYGKALLRRRGEDLSIVTAGFGVPVSLKAAEILAARGIRAEVVDLRTISPIDGATVNESVARTRRLAVVDFGWPRAGLAAEIIAEVTENQGLGLKANPLRVTLPDGHTPMSSVLEEQYYPDEKMIAGTIADRLMQQK